MPQALEGSEQQQTACAFTAHASGNLSKDQQRFSRSRSSGIAAVLQSKQMQNNRQKRKEARGGAMRVAITMDKNLTWPLTLKENE